MSEIGKTFEAALRHESLQPIDQRVRIMIGTEVLVDTNAAILFHKRGNTPIVFVPRDDVRSGLLSGEGAPKPQQHERDALYWSPSVETRIREHLAWRFTELSGELKRLDGYVAFDPSLVTFDMENEEHEEEAPLGTGELLAKMSTTFHE